MTYSLVINGLKRATFFVALIFLFTGNIYSKEPLLKALWVVRDDMISKDLIDKFISYSVLNGYKHIFVQVRGRGDAYYDSKLVPRSHLLSENNFDPLAYVISKSKDLDIKIHAWLNVYYLWSSPFKPNQKDHLLLTKPEWIDTYLPDQIIVNETLEKMKLNRKIIGEGFYLAPTHPEVEIHLQNVITELLQNYQLDGIHFDYIRFHDAKSGMNPIGLKVFLNHSNSLPGLPSLELKKTPSFSDFKRYSITNFIRKASYRIKAYQPNCIISAAVKPQLQEARNNFHQEWDEWLIGGYIDWAVPMNYTSNSDTFEKNIRIIKDDLPKKYLKRIIMGIGVYNQNHKSSLKKIEITKNYNLLGYSIFSYTSLKNDKSYSEKFNKMIIKNRY